MHMCEKRLIFPMFFGVLEMLKSEKQQIEERPR